MPRARGPRQPEKSKRAAEERAKRALAILNMRLHGFPLSKIARELPAAGYARLSSSQIRRIIRAALEEAAQRPAEELLRMELLRLDELQSAQYAKAIKGDAPAMDRVLAIMDRRAKLLGLHQARPEGDAGAGGAKQALLDKLDAIAERLRVAPASSPRSED
ncbi:MAG TPA: hypothetical protein VK446_12995 [Methylocystis sp.]|nr:hypothetical protein [Methylocystis sp.]